MKVFQDPCGLRIVSCCGGGGHAMQAVRSSQKMRPADHSQKSEVRVLEYNTVIESLIGMASNQIKWLKRSQR